MRYLMVALMLVSAIPLVACQDRSTPAAPAPASDAPFPATWTPTWTAAGTATATLVVRPTPTWDGTPPPPSRAFVPRMSGARLDRAIRDGEQVTVVDGRTLAAYRQTHIPGALHIPFMELAARNSELDAAAAVVLYTWFQDETEGLDAAMALYGLGFSQVAVLQGGIQSWRGDGYPVEGSEMDPTPDEIGPPWTVTPLVTSGISVTGTVTATLVVEDSDTPTVTRTVTE